MLQKLAVSGRPFIMNKLRDVRGKLGEFWAHIVFFWLAWVGRNQFINTKFTTLAMEIADSYYECEEGGRRN